jgi:hypothetical protein
MHWTITLFMLTKKTNLNHQNNLKPKQNPIKEQVYINNINNIIYNDIINYIHTYIHKIYMIIMYNVYIG